MTIFENSWGYKCPVPLENIPDRVKFITAELKTGRCSSPIRIKVQGFSKKPWPLVSSIKVPAEREDDIHWVCEEKIFETILEGDHIQVALSIINNGLGLNFGKCIWKVPLYKLNTYEVKQFVSTYDIEAVGIEIINKDIAKMLVDDMPMYALRSILNFKQENHPDSFDKTTKVITCSVKI
jgi:hypothetical protein